MKYESDKLL